MLSLLPRVSIGYREGWRRGRVLLASFGPGLVVYFGARPGWGFVVLGNGGEMGADGEGRISAEVRALGIFTRLFFVSFFLSFSSVLAVCFASSACSGE